MSAMLTDKQKGKDAKRYVMVRFYLVTLLEVDVSPILKKES